MKKIILKLVPVTYLFSNTDHLIRDNKAWSNCDFLGESCAYDFVKKYSSCLNKKTGAQKRVVVNTS